MTLTCTVELNPAVDVSVTVSTKLINQTVSSLTATTQIASDLTDIYTTTTVISLFGRNWSGVYTCTATVSQVSMFLLPMIKSKTITVTVGIR